MYTRAYATWQATLVCAYLPVCVPVRRGALFFREQSGPDCSAGKHQCPTSASMSPPFHRSAGEGQCPRDAFLCHHLALLRTRFSVPLSTNALATMPQLRWKAQLCSKRSAERSQDTNSGFWLVENKKKRATSGRLATKSPFERIVRRLSVDKATVTANGKHVRRPL